MLASYNNALERMQMLLAKGARVDERNDKGHLEIVKALVCAGADVRANNGLGATPYTFAVMFGRREVANYLLSVSEKQGWLAKMGLKFINLFAKKPAVAVRAS